jgi:DHA3 family macrolide efflux protein-like MFS transporter
MKTYLKGRLSLFKQRAYRRFFFAAVLATFANGFIYIANTWLVVSLNHSLSAVIGSFLAYWLPNAILSPFVGTLIDRVDRKYIVGFSFILLGLCFGVFGIVLNFSPHLPLHWIYLTYVVFGALGAFIMPGIMAFIREIIANKDLLYANANLGFGYQMGNVCGIGAAGYVIHVLGFSSGYLLAALLFVMSGLVILSISNKHRTVSESKASEGGRGHWLGDFKAGLQYLWGSKALKVLYATQLFLMLMIMVAPILVAPFAKTILHASAIDFGHIEATLTLGMILGGLVMIYLAEKIGFSLVLLCSTVMVVVALLGFSLVNTVIWGQVAYFFIGLGLGCWSILASRTQTLTDPDYQGRVQSVFGAFTAIIVVLFFIVMHMAVVSSGINIRHVYWVAGILAIVPIGLILIFPRFFADKNKAIESEGHL